LRDVYWYDWNKKCQKSDEFGSERELKLFRGLGRETIQIDVVVVHFCEMDVGEGAGGGG
jgi:hypothetical protein